jgi:hypothetical protein
MRQAFRLDRASRERRHKTRFAAHDGGVTSLRGQADHDPINASLTATEDAPSECVMLRPDAKLSFRLVR